MPRYIASVQSPAPPHDVYRYLADFTTIAEWDPGVGESELVAGESGRTGSRYRVVSVLLGFRVPLEYETVEATAPDGDAAGRLVMRAETADFVSCDVIEVVAEGSGSRVTYDADLRPQGLRRLAEPAFWAMFQLIGKRAERGLGAMLAALPQEAG